MNLVAGRFYYIQDKYYTEFPDPKLMPNKPDQNGREHGRPCCYSFRDEMTGLYWVIPISSKVEKYERYEMVKRQKYGRCDTILFGDVLGKRRAFLIQNMFPVTEDYIDCVYIDKKTSMPVAVRGDFKDKLEQSAKRVLALMRRGNKGLVFPDVLSIELALMNK